ncbi:hypothetical protein AB9F39_36020, partial [Rhizobium leguminosarum]
TISGRISAALPSRPTDFASPALVRRGIRPDIVTDQTSAQDPINGYLPKGWTMGEGKAKRESDPKAVEKEARPSMREHVEAMIAFWNAGVP